MARSTQNLASEWLNGRVTYGGPAVRRCEVIEHLRAQGADERSIGHFTLKPTVEVTAEEAAIHDYHWQRIQAIERLCEEEDMTFSDAQAVLDAEGMVAAA